MTVAEPEPRKTGFYESCLAEGASFVEFRGWWLAAEFAGVEEEYWALRRRAGMSDPAALPKWRVGGPDPSRCLDWLWTNPPSTRQGGPARHSPNRHEGREKGAGPPPLPPGRDRSLP